ncbi:MAG: ferritin-like domain-containing protein [Candidatus Omnitrophica bacterium]|nr:ferritin-like domain-containing protein [Candidatus Omnitrophota bacterium]MCA9438406.1 ferritin-like domain-containing protein [Candidatus Omnitrophota bacterium]
MGNQKLIQTLNEQLNREVSTFLRYMLQAASIKGEKHETAREMYLEEVGDEVGHAQYLANQIVMLGGMPKLEPDLTPPPSDVREMLERDSSEEANDVKNYIKLASLAEQEGLYALKMKMEDQAADEDEHGHEMKRLLG